jgi:hypothetical protein
VLTRDMPWIGAPLGEAEKVGLCIEGHADLERLSREDGRELLLAVASESPCPSRTSKPASCSGTLKDET